MKKILFLNGSPNKNGNTVKLAKAFLNRRRALQLDVNDYVIGGYGRHLEGDAFEMVYQEMKNADIIIWGTPVYWYAMSAPLKAILDRIYDVYGTNDLKGKDLYMLIQGSAPSQETLWLANYTMERFSTLYGMTYHGYATNVQEAKALGMK